MIISTYSLQIYINKNRYPRFYPIFRAELSLTWSKQPLYSPFFCQGEQNNVFLF